MLDSTKIRSNLNAAANAFANGLVALLIQEVSSRRESPVVPAKPQPRPPAPKPAPVRRPEESEAQAPAPATRSLLRRPNVIRVPSGAPLPPRSTPTVAPYEQPESLASKPPTAEEVAAGVVRIVTASEAPLTLKQMSVRLRASKESLGPIVEGLVAQEKIRLVEFEGENAYKPPRIEPIKRRRDATV